MHTETAAADLQGYADAWRERDPGDILEGEVVGLSSHDNGYGRYPIVTVRMHDGHRLALHAWHAVAKMKLVELRPEIGEQIQITYLGMKQPRDPKAKPYNNYSIVMPDRPASGGIDWDAIDTSDAPSSIGRTKTGGPAQDRAVEAALVREDSPKATRKAKAAAAPSDEIPF